MSELKYWDLQNSTLLSASSGKDFVSPASQDVISAWSRPLWKSSEESRNRHLPFWDRPDIFRTVSYNDVYELDFGGMDIETLAAVATPSGSLYLDTIYKPTTIVVPDFDLYSAETQKIFTLFCQFDTMVESQVIAFTGLDEKVVRKSLLSLHARGILEKNRKDWKHQEKLGDIWMLNIRSQATIDYPSGMDSLWRICGLGNFNLSENIPPGSGSNSAIKHNLFAAEIMLSMAETCDNIAGVYGDLFASAANFHVQNPQAEKRNSHGDAISVTKDGVINIFEFVGNIGNTPNAIDSLIEKTASWVGVIASSQLDINVLFVDTTWHYDRRDFINAVHIGVDRESKRYAPEKFTRDRAIDHIGIINASWWYPEDNVVSQAETRMLGYCPNTRNYKCFDEPDTRFSTDEQRKNIVMNTASTIFQPPWIRNKFYARRYE